MLTPYDDLSLAVVVFNRYGDIVYTNHHAEGLIVNNRIDQISHRKIRLMAESLIMGLTLAPLTFHATTTSQSLLLCHIHRWHNSYTLTWRRLSEYNNIPKPNLSKLIGLFFQKI